MAVACAASHSRNLKMVDLVERDKSGFGGRADGGGASDLMPGIKEAGDDRSLEIKMRHQLTESTYRWSKIT